MPLKFGINKQIINLVVVCSILPFTGNTQDFETEFYGPGEFQFLDIYLANSDCPSPVYFDAHFNGGTTAMPANITNSLTSNGISVVSWESVPFLDSPDDIVTGWSDASLMFEWVKENAEEFNFDTTNFIIGGSSRGTILSWKYAHSGDPDIKGLYMYNALPEGVWTNPDFWLPTEDVTENSPPVFFVYRREPGCADDPIEPDIHDPLNGFAIMDEYTDLGIGDRDTLIHSLIDSANTDRYQYLLEFALSVVQPCGLLSSGVLDKPESQIQVFPNPTTNQFNLTGLKGDEYFTLYDVKGRTLGEGKNPETLNFDRSSPGLYILTVQSETYSEQIKIIKE